MASTTQISVREYLNTSYRPDCDYIDGEVLERNLGEIDHSLLQSLTFAPSGISDKSGAWCH